MGFGGDFLALLIVAVAPLAFQRAAGRARQVLKPTKTSTIVDGMPST
jgi:hypothetical protein